VTVLKQVAWVMKDGVVRLKGRLAATAD